jgi:integrase/recombinase XerD
LPRPVTQRGASALPADSDVEEFLDYLRYERGMSPNTVAAYRRDLSRYAGFLSDRGRLVAAAEEADLQEYFAAYGGDGASASVARRMASLRSFYAYLVREGSRRDDPAARLRTPRKPQKLPHVLSAEEVSALLDVADSSGALGQRDLAALELLYGSGLRISELLGLHEADIDLEGGLVRCIGKGDKERVVPMGGAAVAAVRRYMHDGRRRLLGARRRSEIFLNARGGALTRQGLAYILRRILARADMSGEASAHTFRHSFATHLLAGGADLRSVQEMLGHANVATTQVYTHVTVEHLREVFLETHPRARRRGLSPEGGDLGSAGGDPAVDATGDRPGGKAT